MLGRRFACVAARWPDLTSALVGRAVKRSHALALSATISCTTGLEMRLLMLFWHLADRWGKVCRDGVVVPIQMTHAVIGRLIARAARRCPPRSSSSSATGRSPGCAAADGCSPAIRPTRRSGSGSSVPTPQRKLRLRYAAAKRMCESTANRRG